LDISLEAQHLQLRVSVLKVGERQSLLVSGLPDGGLDRDDDLRTAPLEPELTDRLEH